MRLAWLLVLAASGCRSILSIGDPPDRPPDAMIVVPACESWHPSNFDPCKIAVAADLITLDAAGYVYDTSAKGGTLYNAAHDIVVQSDQTLMQTDGTTISVLAVGKLTTSVGSELKVIGPRPLLLVSGSSITVAGAIDASSHLRIADIPSHQLEIAQLGAGANRDCATGAGHAGGDATSGGSGGGGGGGGQRATDISMQGSGGAGGVGAADPAGVPGGALGLAATVGAIRSGCNGGSSGAAGSIAKMPAQAGARALGGPGGGALRLVARDAITVTGTITANGAGGGGAPTNSSCGGGGGGSGGYIGFEAPVVMLGGIITANAGGGGSGGTSTATGSDGTDGTTSKSPAPGGTRPSACPGNGGAGTGGAAVNGSAASSGGCADSGGGGGGGGAGIIVIRSPDLSAAAATLSPAPTME